jgi:hypothetical protein
MVVNDLDRVLLGVRRSTAAAWLAVRSRVSPDRCLSLAQVLLVVLGAVGSARCLRGVGLPVITDDALGRADLEHEAFLASDCYRDGAKSHLMSPVLSVCAVADTK